jgi:hypothetical protein
MQKKRRKNNHKNKEKENPLSKKKENVDCSFLVLALFCIGDSRLSSRMPLGLQ